MGQDFLKNSLIWLGHNKILLGVKNFKKCNVHREIVLIFLSNSAVRLRQNKGIKQLIINSSENIFSTLLVITNLLRLITVFIQPFSFLFLSLFVLRKECNYCEQRQGIKWMPLLYVGTLFKISFKSLTEGFYTSDYENHKILTRKHIHNLYD